MGLDTLTSAHGSTGRHATDWKERLGRIGLVGRGALYAVVALLAIQLAIGSPDAEASSDGAFAWIGQQPFGKVLLVLMTAALFALAAWRFLDAAVGDPVDGDEATDRIRFVGKGIIYTALAFAALSTTLANWGAGGSGGGSGSGGGESEQRATGVVLDWPMGQWIVAAAGLGMIGYAVFMFKHHTIDESFMKRLSGPADGVRPVGRIGYGARSVVWAIIGVLLVQAAVTYNPDEAGGLSTALLELSQATGGPVLLGLVALGLLAFGVFCVAEARYRSAA